MIERIDVAAYWGDRKESLDKCAHRAVACLRQLAECDEIFSRWFQGGRSREEALERPFEISFESCFLLMKNGRSYDDSSRKTVERLGFSMGLWNGRDGDSTASIRFQSGAYPAAPQIPNPNNCIIELPYGGPAGNRVLGVSKLKEIVTAVIRNWEPDWGRVLSFDMRKVLYPELYLGVEVGWLTYLSNIIGMLPKLPKDCDVIEIAGFGRLITIEEIDRFTVSNALHVDVVRRLSRVLNDSGMLTPRPRRQTVSRR